MTCMTDTEFVRLASELAMKAATGEKLLPWPELPQDLAFLAFIIDRLREPPEVWPKHVELYVENQGHRVYWPSK